MITDLKTFIIFGPKVIFFFSFQNFLFCFQYIWTTVSPPCTPPNFCLLHIPLSLEPLFLSSPSEKSRPPNLVILIDFIFNSKSWQRPKKEINFIDIKKKKTRKAETRDKI